MGQGSSTVSSDIGVIGQVTSPDNFSFGLTKGDSVEIKWTRFRVGPTELDGNCYFELAQVGSGDQVINGNEQAFIQNAPARFSDGSATVTMPDSLEFGPGDYCVVVIVTLDNGPGGITKFRGSSFYVDAY